MRPSSGARVVTSSNRPAGGSQVCEPRTPAGWLQGNDWRGSNDHMFPSEPGVQAHGDLFVRGFMGDATCVMDACA